MEAKELKIEDVMCGDWVDVRNDASPNTPHIEKITPSHLLRDEHWYGIKLTPEILEKNGFKHNEIWHNSFQDIDNYHINILFGYGGKVDSVRITELGEDKVIPSEKTIMYLTHIQYVNELQHALRLCGIEKNIEL